MKSHSFLFLSVVAMGWSLSAAGLAWPDPTREMKPWVYNWWMGSAVDAAGLEHQCRELSEKGFGGFHVIPIYGANGTNNCYRAQWKTLLSSAWIDAWNLAARTARTHDLGIDLTMGSGWCFGGPWIDKDHAASSGMKVKRGGPGGTGYMIDPFDPEAMKIHVAQFDRWFGKNGTAERPRAFYHDSYEYYGATPKGGGDVDEKQLACFRVWTDWCRANGYLTRNEAHGAPSNWLDFYGLADIPETEMFGRRDRDILISKFASSAAHVKGTTLVSSESCTWIDEHFHERPEEIKRFLDRLFLAGVNHVFYHGLCYSPVDAVWPGWTFYASLEMNPRNPIWREMGALNAYVTRCQSLFQTWSPDNDLAIVWDPTSYRAKHPGETMNMSVHARDWFYGEPIGAVAKYLYAKGYAFDYISPRQLQAGLGAKYAEVIDPEKATTPTKARPMPFTAETGLLATRWTKDGQAGYFVVNDAKEPKTIRAAKPFVAMNPLDGTIATMDVVTIEPGHSLFVVGEGLAVAAPVVEDNDSDWSEAEIAEGRTVLDVPWHLTPVAGGPALSAPRTLDALVDWRTFDEHFSGTIRYETKFTHHSPPPPHLSTSLNLGEVAEIAHVWINGHDLGTRFMAPYVYAIPPEILRDGENDLVVEVTNLGANRLRWNDVNGVCWKYFTDINMVGIDFEHGNKYVTMDASTWQPLKSGLIGPVTLSVDERRGRGCLAERECPHTFALGEQDFLLDGKPFVIRCGEVHYARIPRAYWRHRLQMLRAMGCNAVGCYMFWNFHEREKGVYSWEGRADAAAFCRMAQEEGLWVILRPGPYSCAEWEGGGAPWWLMADDLVDAKTSSRQKGISMRSSDPRWVKPATAWLAEVGRVLAPLQVTRGGPILMVQVENEYGLHGNDLDYMKAMRQAVLDAGFEVPLYACNPPRVIQNGFLPELFQAANFGADPKQRFEIIRQWQPKGPLMCSEYYPAWFDTWGQAHHPPKSDREFFGPIDWMLERRASFSLYMAHGGTSFGGWTGCRNPFVPNVTSYDYEAPINEHGRANPSFAKFRERAARYLNPGETIPAPPADIPTKAYGTVVLTRACGLDALVTREVSLERPVYMEQLGQGFGLVSYERELGPDEGGMLSVDEVHDFGYVFLDDERIGTFDRRHRGLRFRIYRAKNGARRKLRIVLEAMGRINSSSGMEDRKGLNGRVRLDKKELLGWTAKLMPIDPDHFSVPSSLSTTGEVMAHLPTLYRGTLSITHPADTFIDMTTWTKGIAWVNGHNLGRFWSIGPQQTLYVPGCWLKEGANEVVILDFFGPRGASDVVFRETPILDKLQPETDFNRTTRPTEKFVGGTEIATGTFPDTDEAQVVMFETPVRGSFFTLQARTTHDKKNLATISEFDLLDRNGNPLTALGLTVSGVDSEEEIREDGVAENAIDGQIEACWQTSSRTLPHWIEFAVPQKTEIHGFRYTPKQNKSIGRIKDWTFFAR